MRLFQNKMRNKRVKVDSVLTTTKKCFVNHHGLPVYTTEDEIHETYVKELILPLIQVGKHFGLPKDLIKLLAGKFYYRECPILDFMNDAFGFMKTDKFGRKRRVSHMIIHGFDVDPKIFYDFYTKLLRDGCQTFFRKPLQHWYETSNDSITLVTEGKLREYWFQFYKKLSKDQEIPVNDGILDLDEEFL